mgnify:CR=1 FL=1
MVWNAVFSGLWPEDYSGRRNKQAAVFSSLGAAITYVFCYYNVQIAGINAVVWGLLAGGILYFMIGNITCKNGLDEDIIKKLFLNFKA